MTETLTHLICNKCLDTCHIDNLQTCQICENYNICSECIKPINRFGFTNYWLIVCKKCKNKLNKNNDLVDELNCEISKINDERQYSLFKEYKNRLKNEINEITYK